MSDRPPSQNQVKAKFIGGAQEQYDSFKDLATYALGMFSPNWKFKSYMFPPVYSYGRPEVSDHAIEEAKKKAQEQAGSTSASQESGSAIQKEKKAMKKKQEGSTSETKGNSNVTTRQKSDSQLDPTKAIFYAGLRVGDTAEHIVYVALEAISHVESISPMIIINNLDLNRIKLSEKASIFQNSDKLCGEYDFVIIGPKVGIVVIEVKNANKSKSATQLHSFDKVIDFLKEEYPAISLPAEFLERKLVIFVNSTKSSHKPDSLPKPVKNVANKVKHFDSLCNSMRIWDQDDIKNRANHISKPAFYSKFYDFFHETGYNISDDVYESFAPTLVGLASFLTFKTSSSSVDLRLDLLKISEAAVLTVDSCRLRSQNPEDVKAIPKLETVRNFNMVLLPTPDQQKALAEPSPNRQFIIGAPGTGKTIILQQKALKMLQDGKKVLILTASSYIEEFKKFLEINCPDLKMDVDYLIVDSWSKFDYWKSTETEFLQPILKLGNSLCFRMRMEKAEKMDPILFIKNCVETDQYKTETLFCKFDCILIDDACDHVDIGEYHWDDTQAKSGRRFGNLATAVMCMAAFEIIYPSKTLWIATDLVQAPFEDGLDYRYMKSCSLHRQVMNCLLSNSKDKISEYPFDTYLLNQIMRHSENIFKVVYTTDVLLQLRLRPIIRHKIVGKVVTKISCDFKPGDTYETLWIVVKKVLDQIRDDQISLNFVCILIGGGGKWLLETFQKKCIECSIPTTSTATIKTENEAYQSNPFHQSKACDNKNRETLFLDSWYNVSSREWPIVIFCSTNRLALQRYRAFSRATVKLYDVWVDYASLKKASSRKEISQDDFTLTLVNTGPSTNRKPALKRSSTVHTFDDDPFVRLIIMRRPTFSLFRDFTIAELADTFTSKWRYCSNPKNYMYISPMIIINNLDLSRVYSDKIFQNQDMLRQCGKFDFMITDPKVGTVVIEVSNSNKSKAGSQLKKKAQEAEEGSTTAAHGSYSTCQKLGSLPETRKGRLNSFGRQEMKALQKKRQRHGASTDESKANSSGVTALNTALKRANAVHTFRWNRPRYM